jgi:hypothetical protein
MENKWWWLRTLTSSSRRRISIEQGGLGGTQSVNKGGIISVQSLRSQANASVVVIFLSIRVVQYHSIDPLSLLDKFADRSGTLLVPPFHRQVKRSSPLDARGCQ